MNYQEIVTLVGNLCYGALAIVGLYGVFCVILIWRRIKAIRFRSEGEQTEFLQQVDESLKNGDFQGVAQMCDGDPRAVPQLVSLAVANREIGLDKIRALVVDRFQRDVLADLQYRLSWVNTMIKTAPMLGLYGTVLGMMGAFANLASGGKVDPTRLAENIALALITTAIGLTIAIPLIICTASIVVRISKLEDLVGTGLTRFLESLKAVLGNPGTGEA